MATLSGVAREQLVELQDGIVATVSGATSLEVASQRYVSTLYDRFEESIVLARLFATVPMSELPEAGRTFVAELAASAGIANLIRDRTLVLSLLGTRGARPEWNDRLRSRGHLGIPLASADFVDRIPMVARLLRQLGAGLDWLDGSDTELVARTFREVNGVFYVPDAATEADSRGRKIITAQDFVAREGVRTVFGIGGSYMGTSTFFTTIVFLREHLDRAVAERFMLQASKFKAATLVLVDEGRFFG